MSCDVSKLDYLKETKELFRDKLDPTHEKITDDTKFRDYLKYMGGTTAGTATAKLTGGIGIAGNAEEE